MKFRETTWDQWPVVDAEQMREVDRIMIDELHITLLQMMENAGRNLALLAHGRFAPARVLILAGGGGNGGGGLAAARHLTNHGIDVQVVLAKDHLGDATARQRDTLTAMRIEVATAGSPLRVADLIIDAMIGYSLKGHPEGGVADLISWTRNQPAPVLSLDVPSGFDAATGTLREPHVRAAATLTLAAPKRGLDTCGAGGEIYVGDISVPSSAYQGWAATCPAPYAGEWVVRVLPTDSRGTSTNRPRGED